MNWRDHTWELTVSALSWIVAIAALGFVVVFVAYDAIKSRRRRRKEQT